MRWICSVDLSRVPYAVQLVTTRLGESCNKEPNNTFYVRNVQPDQKEKQEKQFTICVPTMHNWYDDVAEFVEMVEVNTLFGVDKIVLYNYSTGYNIQPYLRSYQEEGKVDIVQWPVPDKLVHPPKVHNHGLMAVVNDCMYRYMYKTRYTVVADLDELIVPRTLEHSTWSEMVAKYVVETDPAKPPVHGALNFRCTFFRKELVDAETARNTTIKDLGIRSLLNVNREVKIWPKHSRTKYIVPPELVDVAGVHFVHVFVSSISKHSEDQGVKLSNIDVPVEHALMHHYRLWEDPPSGPPPVVEDRFMHNYRDEIVSRVWDRHLVVRLPGPSGHWTLFTGD